MRATIKQITGPRFHFFEEVPISYKQLEAAIIFSAAGWQQLKLKSTSSKRYKVEEDSFRRTGQVY